MSRVSRSLNATSSRLAGSTKVTMSNYGDLTEDQLRYWRDNPSKPPSKYREDWERGIPHIPEVRDPLYIDMIDSVITPCSLGPHRRSGLECALSS